MSEIKLKPCPFCGGEAKTRLYLGIPSIQCFDCCAVFTIVSTEKETINAWNTRKPMERIVEQLQREQWSTGYPQCGEGDAVYHDAMYKAIEIVKAGGLCS